MSEQPSPPPRQRRSSFVEFFSGRASSSSAVSSSPPPGAVPASPSAPQHRRGVSISTLGLTGGGAGGAQGQTNPYTAFARHRRASVATSSASNSPELKNSFGDEPAVLEEDDTLKPTTNSPAGQFGRRLSFGAQALRDVKSGGPGSPGAGRRPSSSLFRLDENHTENESPSLQRQNSSGAAKTAGEGFNWSEALRDRTKRSPSFSANANPFAANGNKPRASAASAPASTSEPPKEMPKPAETQPMRMKKPDHLGERMLRGDFMMD